jgi:hypothetical protein
MKWITGILLALIVAGCSGVSTGQRSDCFGRTNINDTFVTRNGTSVSLHGALSAVVPVDDCGFVDF